MRKEPMTTMEFFNAVTKRLESQGKLPDSLEYALPSKSTDVIKTSEFNIRNVLDYDGDAGICLDLQIEEFKDGKTTEHRLGTFKTLHTGREYMEEMGTLLGSFIAEARNYVAEHEDDFNWEFFGVRPVSRSGERQPGVLVVNLESAKKTALSLLEKYDSVSICDYTKRTEVIGDRKAVAEL